MWDKITFFIEDIKYYIELLIEKMFECPFCHGEGGETDVITDDGCGPYYPCEICNRTGKMNIFRKLYFWMMEKIWEAEMKQKLPKWLVCLFLRKTKEEDK
jgi:hypothetical protein